MSNSILNQAIHSEYAEVIQISKTAGEIQKEYFRTRSFKIKTKSSAVDLVTEVDVKCDQYIVEQLKRLFPEDQILSEEQGLYVPETKKSAYKWIIDPLDGTTNFSNGIPIFAVSIARWCENKPVFGVVYVPMLDELFYAEKGRGAYHNHERIQRSDCDQLNQAVVGTGFPYNRATARNNNGENIQKMIPLIKGARRLGAAAYDLCLVAMGVLDAFWELRLAQWDLAAGMLIIEEAGGTFYYIEEGQMYNVITGNEHLVAQIQELVDLEN
ncbi:inositol monophosphatase family protein [Fusibacter ferrireducens]|uniref:Inositol-1-monophosphatase n=1 Tax=Fusibacter ferrireducens TaxID=2785058 RepID=A0ABR9ZR98_9FIRM|nr:inositol monophosphatase family protein [Fusibacter ferrireducens]MBF4692981.1 inositol monophosphatase [Fusibacter ferrireducens]